MVEGETSRIGERSTETISGDTSGGRRDLSNRYSAPVIGGQKIDVEKFDGKINFGISCLTKEVKYLVKDEECVVTLWRTLEEKYLLKSPENRLHAMSQVYGFRMKPGVSMHDHVSRFEKLFADLKNLDKDIKDEVKAMIMLHSLPEEYSHFVTTLIYGKSVIAFKDVCTALTKLEIKVLNEHCLKLCSSEWILDTGATYHLCPIKEWFTDFRNLKSGKKTRVKFGTANHDTREILEYVHSDVWGPTKTASIGGSHYFVTFVDDFSRRVWVYTMRAKDEVLEIFVKWKKLVETQTGRKIKVLRSDNGGEYTSDPFLQVCQNEGIKRHFTVRHTPQQNSVAERMNRTLLEKVRCMLSNAGLDKRFWAEAVSYASHLVNRLPSAAIGGKTPMEMWSGKYAQDYDFLRIFRCLAYYHVKDAKLDPRARKAIFMVGVFRIRSDPFNPSDP
ncbi:Integrase catalytic domain-containing protein [Citrus sinensis]|nr:Integrase catalytic domain-containing protein [Citrus sinensis]